MGSGSTGYGDVISPGLFNMKEGGAINKGWK